MPQIFKGKVKFYAVEQNRLAEVAGILRAVQHLDPALAQTANVVQAVAEGKLTMNGLPEGFKDGQANQGPS